ncbi:MAG: hypothetical protein IPK81_25185 [Rhodospirillales bacterium]|nr:MAG: hypothetical protein IPK81_25185 [Rhodospirillales bacterium]
MSDPRDIKPTIARISRGRARRAGVYARYNFEVGARPPMEKALGVQSRREDRDDETEFHTISHWARVAAMSRFTGGDPAKTHHLDRDAEFLIERPKAVQILRLYLSHGRTG